ncbi:MAG: DNA-binding protein [Dethiobacter sp.]|nr:MAG: DNA-binding protein [Dethiobacter sp.]
MERFENTEIKWTLSVEEAAVVLDVNVNTVYEYCRQGMIPNRRLGKRVVIPRPALLKWLDESAANLREKRAI